MSLSQVHYLPLAPPFFFILVGLFVALLVLIQLGVLRYAYMRLGISSGAALNVAETVHPLQKGVDVPASCCGRACAKESDRRQPRRLLRARREGPRDRRAAEQHDELAAFHFADPSDPVILRRPEPRAGGRPSAVAGRR